MKKNSTRLKSYNFAPPPPTTSLSLRYSQGSSNHHSILDSFGSSLAHRYAFWLYFMMLTCYCILIVIYARYTFNLDDIWMWLDIYQSQPIYNGYNPSAGRFFPLASLDLNILMQLSKSPYLFFGFNAVVVWLLGLAVWVILQMVLGSHFLWLRAMVLGVVLFHPGFVTIMVGVCYPERMQVLFLALFVLANVSYASKPTLGKALFGFMAANAAIYYKEPTFLMIGFFGIFMLLASYRQASKAMLAYYASLIVSAAIYLCIYVCFIYPKITKIYQREIIESPREELLMIAKGLFNFMLNDVFLFFLLFAIVIYRIFIILSKKDKIIPIYDSLIFCGVLYLLAFLKLQLFQNYYLIPIYIVTFSSVVHFLFIKGYIRYIFFKAIAIICVLVFSINTLPIGINTFAFLKTEGVKFHSALSFIAKEASNTSELRLYFDGNGENKKKDSDWYWRYFQTYLKELYNTDNVVVFFNESDLKSGDYILLNSSANKMIDSTYLLSMSECYELVYKSSAFGLPYIGLKPIIKVIFEKNSVIKEATYNNANLFKLPIRDYIYKVP